MNISEIRLQSSKDKKETTLGQFYRELSYPIIKLLINTSVTPNMVSYFNIIIVFFTFLLFLFGHYYVGVLFLFTWVIFDYVDGGLARVKNIFSVYDSFLDYLSTKILPPLLFLSIGINEELVLVSLIPVFLYVFSYYPKMFDIEHKKNVLSKFGGGSFLPFIVVIFVIIPFNYKFIILFLLMSIIYVSGINIKILSFLDIKKGYQNTIQKIKTRRK